MIRHLYCLVKGKLALPDQHQSVLLQGFSVLDMLIVVATSHLFFWCVERLCLHRSTHREKEEN